MVDDLASRAAKRRRDPRKKPEITRWKRMLLLGAIVFVAIGIGLRAAGGSDDAATPSTTAAPDPAGAGGSTSSLVEQGSPLTRTAPTAAESRAGGAAPAESSSSWSPFFLKNGFSFLVAFCVGFAARVWLRITLLVAGTLLLAVFALSYFGVLEVDWSTLGKLWDGVAGRIAEEAKDFHGFVTGSLPQAGMAGLGIVAGFKMR